MTLSSSISLPFVSVIMPVRNEAASISRSIGAVLSQEWPAEKMELIVADGISTDTTRALVQRLIRQGANIKLIDNEKKIAAAGLNVAWRHAQGEIIVRVDGHCEIAPDYVRRCVEHLCNRPDVDCVGGPIETVGGSYVSQVISVGMSSVFGVGDSTFRTVKGKTLLVDTVAFPAYRRRAMQQAGEFDEELVRNQDDEYSYRLRKLGAKILLADNVHVRYYGRGSLGSLWRQYYQYGFWKVRVLQKHSRQMRPRQFVPPIFVAAFLLSIVLALAASFGGVLAGTIAVSYIVMNLTASILTAFRTNWRYLLLLPLVFGILHLSYGFGFLAGLIRFAPRWLNGRSPRRIAASAR